MSESHNNRLMRQKINGSLFKKETPSFKCCPPPPPDLGLSRPMKGVALPGSWEKFDSPKVSEARMSYPPERWVREHRWRCWFCHVQLTPPWVIWGVINRGSRCHGNTSASGTRVITLPVWVQLKIFEPFLSPITVDGLSGGRRSSGS